MAKKCKLCRNFDLMFRPFSCDLWIERRLKDGGTDDVNRVKACNQFVHKGDLIYDESWK